MLDITLELFVAADFIRSGGKSVRKAVNGLSNDAYEVATRYSEDFNAVGLTGLVEDAGRPAQTGVGSEDIAATLIGAGTRLELDTMTDNELVAYWNILQFPTLGQRDSRNHRPIVSALLKARGIAHETGKRTVAA